MEDGDSLEVSQRARLLQICSVCKGNQTLMKSDKRGNRSPLRVLWGILSICRVLNKYNIPLGNP
jgi:hypothetical protein